MKRSDLVDIVVDVLSGAGVSKVKAGLVVDALLDAIVGSLGEGNTVSIIGFGTFAVKQRQERTGRNPKTGEPLQIPAKTVVRFTPSKALAEAVESA